MAMTCREPDPSFAAHNGMLLLSVLRNQQDLYGPETGFSVEDCTKGRAEASTGEN